MKRFLAVTVLWLMCLGLVSSSVQAQVPNVPVTDNEIASLVVGMVMGLDMALALQGKEPMGPEKWGRFIDIFSQATYGCHDVKCVTDHVVALRESVKQRRLADPEAGTPWDQRKLRTF